jgi:hypothetical protein
VIFVPLGSYALYTCIRENAKSGENARVVGDEKYGPGSLANFFNLVSHSERRSPRDMLQRTLMALFLLHGLGRGAYFGGGGGATAKQLTPDQATVGAALLLALQVTQFNSHEVSELVSQDNDAGWMKMKLY